MTEIESAWDFAMGHALAAAPEAQRREMQKAFYSGAHSMLVIALKISGECGGDDAQAGARLDAIAVELDAFLARFKPPARFPSRADDWCP